MSNGPVEPSAAGSMPSSPVRREELSPNAAAAPVSPTGVAGGCGSPRTSPHAGGSAVPALSPRRDAQPTSPQLSPRGGAGAQASPQASPMLSPRGGAASPMLSPRGGAASPMLSPRAPAVPLDGDCVLCLRPMGNMLGTMCNDGPLHNECVVKYRLTHKECCMHCDRVLGEQRMVLAGKKVHPDCVADYKANRPFVRRSKEGTLKKFSVGRSSGLLSSKNWKERYFLLGQDNGHGCLFYYDSASAKAAGKPPTGSIPLPKGTTRLITRPMRKHHPEATNVSREFVIVFSQGGVEQRLLCQSATWEEHEAWCDCLHDYIREVDAVVDAVEIV